MTGPMTDRRENPTLGSFLLPTGFARPRVTALVREGSVVVEAARGVASAVGETRQRRGSSYAARTPRATGDPVILVPGFMAGDGSLAAMSGALRRRGFRTFRSHIRANVGCTLDAVEQLERRIESIAIRRDTRVAIVGHSLGGMLARGLAVRRPDLVSNIVTLGSPMLAPGAHHLVLTASVDALVRLSRAGVPGLMAEDCVAGACARQSFEESREPVPAGVGFTAVYSRRDGVVDWRACVDPEAMPVEVTTSHLGMAVDPRVLDLVTEGLRRPAHLGRSPVGPWTGRVGALGSVLEVDRGESA